MFWLRRISVYLASIVLFFTLAILAYLVSILVAFHSSIQIKQALQTKQAYDGFITFNTERATKFVSPALIGAIGADKLSPIVRQAVAAAYPKDFYDSSSNKIIDANYDWLTNKTTKPDFAIDLGPAKQRFDAALNNSVGNQLSSSALSTQFSQQFNSSDSLLSNPVITADNPNPFAAVGTATEPYYKQLSDLPRAYKNAKQLPIIIGIFAALTVMYILAVDRPRRHSWRVLARTFILAGALLVAGKLITAILFNKAIVNSLQRNGGGQYSDSFGSIYHSITDVMTHLQLVFGLAYIAVGLIIVIGLLLYRAILKRRSSEGGASGGTTGGSSGSGHTSGQALGQSPHNQPQTNPMPQLIPRKQKPGGLNRRGIIQ